MVNEELNNSKCVITLKQDWINKVNAKNLIFGYKMWSENKNLIVGYKSYSHFHNGTCFKATDDLNNGNSFLGLEFSFVHSYYIRYLIKQADLFGFCEDYETFSEYFFNCFSFLLNLIVNKLNQKSFLKLNIQHEEKYDSFSKNSKLLGACLEDIYENVFKFNKTFFSHHVNNYKISFNQF